MSRIKDCYFNEIEELAQERNERGENDSPPEQSIEEQTNEQA